MIKIQTAEAHKLKKEWGNKHCEHPFWGKEYYISTNTGDYVCLQCGLIISHDYFKILNKKL